MSPMAPDAVVQAQLDAYNAKDIEALLSTYAPDAEQYELHGALLAKGHEQLRPRFLARFEEPNLRAELLSRIVVGDVVTDAELITRDFPEGPGTLECSASTRSSTGASGGHRSPSGARPSKVIPERFRATGLAGRMCRGRSLPPQMEIIVKSRTSTAGFAFFAKAIASAFAVVTLVGCASSGSAGTSTTPYKGSAVWNVASAPGAGGRPVTPVGADTPTGRRS